MIQQPLCLAEPSPSIVEGVSGEVELGVLSRQLASSSSDFDTETYDEGTPKTSTSLSSEDFEFESNPECQRQPELSQRREAFCSESALQQHKEMVKLQGNMMKSLASQRKAEWAESMQIDHLAAVPPSLRLPGLIAEAYRYEHERLEKAATAACVPGGAKEEHFRNLKRDLKKGYTSILAEVNKAVRSSPPPSSPMTVEQHRQYVADQGVQCFATMLPYSDGICGGMTDVRRQLMSFDQTMEEPASLHREPQTKSVRGTTTGSTGRHLPVSLSADHGKAEKVAALRRRGLAKVQAQAVKQRRPSAPLFARTPRPGYKNPLGLVPNRPAVAEQW